MTTRITVNLAQSEMVAQAQLQQQANRAAQVERERQRRLTAAATAQAVSADLRRGVPDYEALSPYSLLPRNKLASVGLAFRYVMAIDPDDALLGFKSYIGCGDRSQWVSKEYTGKETGGFNVFVLPLGKDAAIVIESWLVRDSGTPDPYDRDGLIVLIGKNTARRLSTTLPTAIQSYIDAGTATGLGTSYGLYEDGVQSAYQYAPTIYQAITSQYQDGDIGVDGDGYETTASARIWSSYSLEGVQALDTIELATAFNVSFNDQLAAFSGRLKAYSTFPTTAEPTTTDDALYASLTAVPPVFSIGAVPPSVTSTFPATILPPIDGSQYLLTFADHGKKDYCRSQALALGFTEADLTP